MRRGNSNSDYQAPYGGGARGQADDAQRQQDLCEVRTLDSYHFRNVGFVRIDVDGHELPILQGSVRTLQACGHPPVMITSPPDGPDAGEQRRDLVAFLTSLGYEIHPIRGWSDQVLGVKA